MISYSAEPGTYPPSAPGLLDLIRAEYREMPCLRLTKRQIQRLWSLDGDTCDAVVKVLEKEHFLRRIADAYVIGNPIR
jgi:hypothetical protein